jgi:predicted site-specific integrase-resolvase
MYTISTQQAAKELSVSIRTIQAWFKKGRLPNAFKLDPKNEKNSPLRIPITDIEAIKNSRLHN